MGIQKTSMLTESDSQHAAKTHACIQGLYLNDYMML